MTHLKNRNDGFTIVEMLVAMAIGAIVMAAVYSTYTTQQKSYILQEEVSAMQQNIRAAMYYMTRDIRMAGCDPTGNANAGITAAGPTSISFTMDIRSGMDPTNNTADGKTDGWNESITYAYNDATKQITRGGQALAENIDMLDFVYLDPNGNVLNPNRTSVPSAGIPSIQSVQVTVVARTGRGDQGYINSDSFFNQADKDNPIYTALSDRFHRKTLTSNIRCRNL
jgi:type IV pilus assembly protein PilW